MFSNIVVQDCYRFKCRAETDFSCQQGEFFYWGLNPGIPYVFKFDFDFVRTTGHGPLGQVSRSCLERISNELASSASCIWKTTSWFRVAAQFLFVSGCCAPRDIFRETFPRFHKLFFPRRRCRRIPPPGHTSLAKVILEGRVSSDMTNELARFVSGIRALSAQAVLVVDPKWAPWSASGGLAGRYHVSRFPFLAVFPLFRFLSEYLRLRDSSFLCPWLSGNVSVAGRWPWLVRHFFAFTVLLDLQSKRTLNEESSLFQHRHPHRLVCLILKFLD